MEEGRALLLAVIRQEEEAEKIARLRGLSAEEWEALLVTARRFAVEPVLFHQLKPHYPDPQIPIHLQDRLRSVFYNSAARNMRLFRQLEQILNIFAGEGVSVILLKGAHLASCIYDNLALRPMIDIDLLVKKGDLQRAHQLLIDDGYSTAGDSLVFSHKHLSTYSKQNAIYLEIHFNVAKPPVSDRFNIDELWDRAQRIDLQGMEALTLSPEDLLLHLCIHTSIDNGFNNGVIPYFDIAHTADHYKDQLDWELLWNRSREWNLDRALYLMLALTEKLVGFPIPQEISRVMKPGPELTGALAAAEELIFEQAHEATTSMAYLFSHRNWRAKFKILKQRVLIPPEIGQNLQPKNVSQNRVKSYLRKLARLIALVKIYGKTIWLGFCKDPETVAALKIGSRRNELRDWLMRAEGL
jgi:hypothetical protein